MVACHHHPSWSVRLESGRRPRPIRRSAS